MKAQSTQCKPAPILSYKDLAVWQMGMDLVVASYRIARKLPKIEQFELSAQIRRASVSVPANIAEGYGRRHLGDYIHHLHIANGSLKELETELMLTARLGYCNETLLNEPLLMADSVGRMLSALARSLKRATKDQRPNT